MAVIKPHMFYSRWNTRIPQALSNLDATEEKKVQTTNLTQSSDTLQTSRKTIKHTGKNKLNIKLLV